MSPKLKTVLSLAGAFCAGVIVAVLLMLAFGFRTSHWTAEQVEAARVKAIMQLDTVDSTHPLVRTYFQERSQRPFTLEDMETRHGSSSRQ